MATYFNKITAEQAALIAESPLFFVASGADGYSCGPNGEGPINLSPKSGSPLHVINENVVAYLDYVGSGNETARHAGTGGPATFMVCSFSEQNAAIVKLYGHAKIFALEDYEYSARLLELTASELALPERQIVELEVVSTITSCGYGVPIMSFVSDRTTQDRGRDFKQGKSASSVR